MHSVSDTWEQIFAEPNHRKEVKVSVHGIEYGERRIVSADIAGRLFDTPSIGNAISRTLKLVIVPYDGPNGSVPPLSEVRLYVRLVSPDGLTASEFIPKGVFFSDTAETDPYTGAVTISAFDALTLAGEQFGVPIEGGAVPSRTFTVAFYDGYRNTQKFQVPSGAPLPTPTTPTHEGQQFLSWYPDPADTPTVTRNLRFTAKWAQQYKIVFESGAEPQVFYCFAGDPTPTPETPSKDGFSFNGWLPTPPDTVTGDATYTAQWTELAVKARGDGWTLMEDGTLIIDIPPDGEDGKTPDEIWREILEEIAPYIDDIITIIITDKTPLPPEILEELLEILPNLDKIILPPSVDLERILEIIDALTVIQIVSYPLISDYVVNETLDYKGLQVMKKTPGGEPEDITADCVLLPAEGYEVTEVGDIMVDVIYDGKSLGTFWVAVKEGLIDEGDWWRLYDDGTLSIFCEGDMPIEDFWNDAPWYPHREMVSAAIIRSGATNIKWNAFMECANLTSVEIPNSVTAIDETAFTNSASLVNISVENENPQYASEKGILFDKGKHTLVCYPAGKFEPNYTIPESVTTIGNYAFYDCNATTSVTIPDSVTSIGEHAFSGCALTSVTIPDSVTAIGASAFEYSTLTSVTIPGSVDTISADAFASCDSLTSVTIQDGVTTIGLCAFYGCFSLASVTIPVSVTKIGDKDRSVPEGGFTMCYSLTDVYYGGTREQWRAIEFGKYTWDFGNATIHYNSSGPT